ncbi:hypothetical protein BX285_6732 [Streptomyces sp. 1114.5]|uniref:hypothetical protein n=1 Tax=unclassified Streptomyces TaxID=2593676 RepID=UPI000BCA5314|nr:MULTISPECIES: hypothetical protein [unclassified Streptomyces]RKT09636.1 hypothetical protein BX285_6732 [Streptomyces sp. 1114.5]SOB89045.1 hypothetical protein SAMN06272789_7377 [Streptomyces sp. 1331.2]
MVEAVRSSVECWCCSNGLVVFSVDTDGGRVLLECEECMAGRWAPPGEGAPEDGFVTVDLLTRPASLGEIRASGWERLIRAEGEVLAGPTR